MQGCIACDLVTDHPEVLQLCQEKHDSRVCKLSRARLLCVAGGMLGPAVDQEARNRAPLPAGHADQNVAVLKIEFIDFAAVLTAMH